MIDLKNLDCVLHLFKRNRIFIIKMHTRTRIGSLQLENLSILSVMYTNLPMVIFPTKNIAIYPIEHDESNLDDLGKRLTQSLEKLRLRLEKKFG